MAAVRNGLVDMVIENVRIFTQDKGFCPGRIEIQGDKISGVFLGEACAGQDSFEKKAAVIDGKDCYALPGMIDLHFHGCMGRDICDALDDQRAALDDQRAVLPAQDRKTGAEDLKIWQEIAQYQASVGVTAIAPAVMTLPVKQLKQILKNAAEFSRLQKKEKTQGALLAGINMEGPFISKVKCGAQDAAYIQACDNALAEELAEAAEGLVRILGVAPEKENALRMILKFKDRMRISLAHTAADYETAKRAIDAGACHATHLFNAMPVWHHRNPGVAGAVMDAVAEGKDVTAELICDGIHVHPSVIRAAWKLLGEKHIVLISDSMRAAGMPDGTYTLGGQEVCVQAGRAILKKDGSLAGSVTSLPDCVRYAVKEAGIALEQAVMAATINPAKCLGIDALHGSIAEGKYADIVLWDDRLCQRYVVCRGETVSKSI